ncbi:MAG: hypothetical protein M3N68_12180 [Actinomycetota bacterium]|nr:hypothetical protein [Actinomycetota bacterium]
MTRSAPGEGRPERDAGIEHGAYCTGCGRAAGRCEGRCTPPLDPPRFCASCGRRLAVQVTPSGYRARCAEHGQLSGTA